jgi:DNA-binding beta-propeller fold protein YncE
MKNKLLFMLIVCLIVFLFFKEVNAKTYAYTIGTDGSISKIDADTDMIISNSQLEKSSYVQSGKTSVVADRINNNLFVVTGRLTPSIYVYDLQTLEFKKDLGIKSGNPDVSILISPDGKQLFISWSKEGGWFFDLYNAKNLLKVKNLGKFVWGPITTFASDGSKIYVYDEENDTFQVNETENFTLLDTIDLNTIWKTNGFASGIECYKYENMLIRETKKITQSEPPEVTYFVYDLKNKTVSPRIITGLAGSTGISPDGSKIFIHDEEPIEDARGFVRYYKSSGRLYIFDVATGKKLGTVQFTVDKSSTILGIHPNGNKVYMAGNVQGTKSLFVMDAVNFKVTKILQIPKNTLFIGFYSE